MYDVTKNVIASGRYELADMLRKIDALWLQGDLSDDQRNELVQMAREDADPSASWASVQDQIEALAKQLEALSARVADLEGGEPPAPDEWPEYIQPTGAHDAYHKGDQVTYKGKRYRCIAPDGVAVVWAPDVYPDYWQVEEN